MTRRPAGVTLSAIVLGLAALGLLLFAAVTTLGIVVGSHAPTVPGVTQPSPAFLAAIGMGVVVFYLALAGWAIATLVGLVRMQPWSRISIMVIGGGVAVIGIFSTLLFFAMPTLMASVPLPPNTSPALLRNVFAVLAIVSILIAAVGITWLVYFALKSTREAFLPQPAYQAVNPYAPLGYIPPPPLPHAHTLEFYEAQPLPVYPPPPTTIYAETPPPALPIATPYRAANSGRPVSITIIAILFLIGTVFSLPSVFFLHYPLLLLGFLITGTAAHAVMVCLVLCTLFSGVGLLLLKKPAWYLAIAYLIFSTVNSTLMVLPGGLAKMHQYMLTIQNTMPGTTLQPAFDPFGPPLFKLIILPSMILDLALIVFVIILLWRARWAFETPEVKSSLEP